MGCAPRRQTDPVSPHPSLAHLAGRLVLASGSPRRHQLLAQIGVSFDVVAPDVDETPRESEPPSALVTRLATVKADAVAATRPGDVIVAGDTVVDVGGVVLGKPGHDDEARRMLRLLSGRRHLVHSAIAVAAGGRVLVETVTTAVEFAALTDADIDWYVATGEPQGKAGAYAIQGIAAMFVTAIEGSPSNVVGLPLATLVSMLAGQSPAA
jgi:septum formation protein